MSKLGKKSSIHWKLLQRGGRVIPYCEVRLNLGGMTTYQNMKFD